MPDLKEIYNRIRTHRQEKKKLKDIYRDVLSQSKSYQETLDQLNKLKAKKQELERTLSAECERELEKAERLTLEMKNDQQVLSDVALNMLMKGETVEITDEYDVKYEPIFKVNFKKSN